MNHSYLEWVTGNMLTQVFLTAVHKMCNCLQTPICVLEQNTICLLGDLLETCV